MMLQSNKMIEQNLTKITPVQTKTYSFTVYAEHAEAVRNGRYGRHLMHAPAPAPQFGSRPLYGGPFLKLHDKNLKDLKIF